MATDLTVAKTIAEQIGRGALFMMGARDLVGDSDSLRFRIGRNSKSINLVRVKLDPSDTYSVTFYRVRAGVVRVASEVSDVYNDSLREILERETGLCLTMPRFASVRS